MLKNRALRGAVSSWFCGTATATTLSWTATLVAWASPPQGVRSIVAANTGCAGLERSTTSTFGCFRTGQECAMCERIVGGDLNRTFIEKPRFVHPDRGQVNTS